MVCSACLYVSRHISALDELEDDEDFATAGTDDRVQGVGDTQGIKAMEVIVRASWLAQPQP